MALQEGCRRLRTAGKVLLLCALTTLVLGTVLYTIEYALKSHNIDPFLAFLFPILFFSLVFGCVLWFLGWIIEGFAAPRSAEPDRHP